jgi:hypothetical protein
MRACFSREGLPEVQARFGSLHFHQLKEIPMNTTIDSPRRRPKTAIDNRMRVSLSATLLFLASAALCDAHSVLVTAQNVWNNDVIYTAEMNTVANTGCEKQIVGAPQIIEVPDPTTGLLDTYEFLFWDINAVPYTATQVNFQPICGVPNTAVAVYLPLGPGCPPTPVPGCPPTTDTVLAYSLNDHKVIPPTPIASATGGWTPGATVVTPPTTINALPQIYGFGNFKDWLEIGGTKLDSSPSLSLSGAGEIVLALYGIPDPDPCAPLRAEYETQIESCIGDGLTPKACTALAKPLAVTVEKCEANNGELDEL